LLLDKAKGQLSVQSLLDTLQQTMEFESSIASKFGVQVSFLLHKQDTTGSQSCFGGQLSEIFKATSHQNARPTTSITTAFAPHMGVYIDAQDKYGAAFFIHVSD
jgi:hypothetical protein